MRVTTSMYYDSIYGTNNQKLTTELFDVNKQIASGIKIQYASDDVRTFTETMRLDNEVTTLGQIKKSTESGYKVADQSDVVLNEFSTSLDRMETLLIQAANETQSPESLDAIANELRGLEEHFKGLANTSINGQYLFSGSAVNTRPIADDGTYKGNDKSMNAFVGSNNQQQYNLTGAELFLGEEKNQNRKITSNVVNRNMLTEYPQLQRAGESNESALKGSDTIRNLMGDVDAEVTPANNYYFYLRGRQSDGTSFNDKITLQDTDTIDNLLVKIGEAYGNSGSTEVVNVTLNDAGEIVVEDKLHGSSKLDFHMVGAVDFDTSNGDDEADIDDPSYGADVGKIDNLDSAETDFSKVVSNPGLFVKEFVKSDLDAPTNISGLTYDRVAFSKDGSVLSSNVSQIVKEDNSFAKPDTKLSEVADLSKNNSATLDGTSFDFSGVDINGAQYFVSIDLAANDPLDATKNGSTFSVYKNDTNGDGVIDRNDTPDANSPYTIYDMDVKGRKAVDADEMTYQQLMDVMNMVATNELPKDDDSSGSIEENEYDNAIANSNFKGNTYLSYDGKIQFSDLVYNKTSAQMSLSDANAGNFDEDASVMTFNVTNSLTISDPKTDFFKTLDQAITAVEEHKTYPDASSGTAASVGIEDAIQMINDLHEHVSRSQAKVGAQSNTLNDSLQRAELLEISTITLRSSVIDTDLAEASLRLTQLNTNYEAMLSTVGKISQLSLVNYL